jgi:hypothetical protein
MTAAWHHAIRKARLHQGLCPSCGTSLKQGYGFFPGGLGAYEACPNRRCIDPHFQGWPDHELEGHAPEADCSAAGASTDMTARSPSSPTIDQKC